MDGKISFFKKKISMFLLFALISRSSFADPVLDLTAFISQEIDKMEEAVNRGSMSEVDGKVSFVSTAPQKDEIYFFRNFWLRIRPRVTFGLPGLIAIQVIPEVEMLFQRETPAEFILYQPDPN